MKAQTILPSGKKKKLDKKNIFEEEVKDEFRVTKLTFPEVQVGAVLEVQYEIYSEQFYALDPWEFQSEIPTIESGVTLSMAPGFIYGSMTTNDHLNKVHREEEEYYALQYNNMKLKRFHYIANDLPAVKKEPYISSLSNYKARLDFQIRGYQARGLNLTFIKDIQTLCDEMLDGEYGSFLKPSGKVKDLVEELTSPEDPEAEKARKLYEYVRDNFEDEDYYSSYYTRKKQDDILKDKKATPSERNLLLLSLLLAADFEAHPVLISTRGHGWVNPQSPFLSQYNRTVVYVRQLNDLLDASDRYVAYGSLPSEDLSMEGLIIKKGEAKLIEILNKGIKSREMVTSTVSIDEQGNASGSTDIYTRGYASQTRCRQLASDDKLVDFISERYASEYSDFVVTTSDTLLKPVATDSFETNFEFAIEGFADVIDDELYLRPNVYLGLNKNIFLSESRFFPVEFGYLKETTESAQFDLPAGYAIVEMPANKVIDNEFFTYRRMCMKLNDDPVQINAMRQLRLKTLTVAARDYQALRQEFGKIVDADQEQVVLKAVQKEAEASR